MHNQHPDYLGTTEESAPYVGHTERTLVRWRNQGTGPSYIRIGRKIRYRKRDLDAWIETNRVVPVRERGAQ